VARDGGALVSAGRLLLKARCIGYSDEFLFGSHAKAIDNHFRSILAKSCTDFRTRARMGSRSPEEE